jgi:hypothetical protein
MDIPSHASVVTSASVVRQSPSVPARSIHSGTQLEEALALGKDRSLRAGSQASADDTARPFATERTAAAAIERKPDSPARAPLLLRKVVAAHSPQTAGVTDSSDEVPRHRVADSMQVQRNHPPETQRAAAPLSTPQRMDTVQFDALIERLVARLELEARRQGRYRWR